MCNCGENKVRNGYEESVVNANFPNEGDTFSFFLLCPLIILITISQRIIKHSHMHTHAAHQCYSALPPSQADRCRSHRGTGRVLRSEDGTLSGRTQRQSNLPHTGTGPPSRHRGCHMAPGTALPDRWVGTRVRKEKKKRGSVRGRESEKWRNRAVERIKFKKKKSTHGTRREKKSREKFRAGGETLEVGEGKKKTSDRRG